MSDDKTLIPKAIHYTIMTRVMANVSNTTHRCTCGAYAILTVIKGEPLPFVCGGCSKKHRVIWSTDNAQFAIEYEGTRLVKGDVAMNVSKSISMDMEELENKIDRLENVKNGAYRERNQLVALLAALALDKGHSSISWGAWLGKHVVKEGEDWEKDWMNIVFIETPSGQLSWHIHDSELELFKGIPVATERSPKWDGHTTEEKYRRIRDLFTVYVAVNTSEEV
jgi:hypothetical protein